MITALDSGVGEYSETLPQIEVHNTYLSHHKSIEFVSRMMNQVRRFVSVWFDKQTIKYYEATSLQEIHLNLINAININEEKTNNLLGEVNSTNGDLLMSLDGLTGPYDKPVDNSLENYASSFGRTTKGIVIRLPFNPKDIKRPIYVLAGDIVDMIYLLSDDGEEKKMAFASQFNEKSTSGTEIYANSKPYSEIRKKLYFSTAISLLVYTTAHLLKSPFNPEIKPISELNQRKFSRRHMLKLIGIAGAVSSISMSEFLKNIRQDVMNRFWNNTNSFDKVEEFVNKLRVSILTETRDYNSTPSSLWVAFRNSIIGAKFSYQSTLNDLKFAKYFSIWGYFHNLTETKFNLDVIKSYGKMISKILIETGKFFNIDEEITDYLAEQYFLNAASYEIFKVGKENEEFPQITGSNDLREGGEVSKFVKSVSKKTVPVIYHTLMMIYKETSDEFRSART